MRNRKNFLLQLNNFYVLALVSVLFVSCEKTDLQVRIEQNASALGQESVTLTAITANNTPYYWATAMIENVTVDNNIYSTVNADDVVTWSGVNGATQYYCKTDCSGLVTKLLKQTYGYTNTYFQNWTGTSNPYAVTYYNEIKAKDHFSQIGSVTNIMQGDIIAIKYPISNSNTGHIMIVSKAPVTRTASSPLVTGTKQYEIEVVDQSSSGHGSLDTRFISSGNFNDGIGRGIFRVYVNSKNSIVGYTWSTYSTSVYYSQTDRPLIVGRLVP
ncbi:MAG: hypothetical protein ACO29O_01405 [Chitinophagaceae bacterium]